MPDTPAPAQTTAPPPTPPHPNYPKTRRMSLRLTETQNAYLKGRADGLGLKVSEYLRYLVNIDMLEVTRSAKDIIAPTWESPAGWGHKR